ncbi:hypothetical protein GCG54_00005093, partial [Colletotrichum gloeosporioides]
LIKLGFIVSPYDEAVFILNKNSYKAIICYHIDDILLAANNTATSDYIYNILRQYIKIQILGEPSTFLGYEFEIDRPNKSFFMHQTKYTQKILNKYNKININPSITPMRDNIKLYINKYYASKEEILQFQQQIGALLYLALKTRFDIALAVIILSRYTTNPSKEHFIALDYL